MGELEISGAFQQPNFKSLFMELHLVFVFFRLIRTKFIQLSYT